MPTSRALGGVLAATIVAETVQRWQFVRIDFPAPEGIVRLTNRPWLDGATYSIALWDALGVAETAQTYSYLTPTGAPSGLRVLGISQEERSPLEVTGVEFNNAGGNTGFWGSRYYTYGLRQLPIVVSEVWWPTGLPTSGAHQGAYLLYIGTTDGCEFDLVAGKASISVIPFRPAHDIIMGEEYDTAEWLQLPDPNTPVVWGPDGAHRLGVG